MYATAFDTCAISRATKGTGRIRRRTRLTMGLGFGLKQINLNPTQG